MNQNHYVKKLALGKNSVAYVSRIIPKTLVVFIHGFNGEAIDTWDNFPALIKVHKKFEDADVLFYGYDTLRSQAVNMSLRFYDFLKKVIDPTTMGYPARNYPANFRYKKILIVAHSLGAVVSRLTLVNAFRDNVKWIDDVRIVYYAPAHWGSRIPGNFKECFSGIYNVLRGFTITKFPIISDLTTGSIVLKELQTTIEEHHRINTHSLRADATIWAENDIVVVNNPYFQDTPGKDIIGASHTSVCKPSVRFLDPFNKLLEHI